jgi:hypothetical protein
LSAFAIDSPLMPAPIMQAVGNRDIREPQMPVTYASNWVGERKCQPGTIPTGLRMASS